MTPTKDQLGRLLNLNTPPTRIVSLVPSLTELLIDLGLDDALCGITKFCIHPKDLRKTKTVVGGTKQVDFDKIRALNPDFILTNKEENTAKMIEELAKITTVYVSDIVTLADMNACIIDIGLLCDQGEKSTQLVEEIQTGIVDFRNFIKDKPRRKVAYFIWHNPWMVVGQDNFINSLLALNKFDNIIRAKRYPQIELAHLQQTPLDSILLSSEPYPFTQEHASLFSAINNAKVMLVDGEYFSWYGSRFVKALAYFKTLHV